MVTLGDFRSLVRVQSVWSSERKHEYVTIVATHNVDDVVHDCARAVAAANDHPGGGAPVSVATTVQDLH